MQLALGQVLFCFVLLVESERLLVDLLGLGIKDKDAVQPWSCPLGMHERFLVVATGIGEVDFLYIILKGLKTQNVHHDRLFNDLAARSIALYFKHFKRIKLWLLDLQLPLPLTLRRACRQRILPQMDEPILPLTAGNHRIFVNIMPCIKICILHLCRRNDKE